MEVKLNTARRSLPSYPWRRSAACASASASPPMNTGGALAATEPATQAAAASPPPPPARPRRRRPLRSGACASSSSATARRARRWCRSATSPRAVSSPSSSGGAPSACASSSRFVFGRVLLDLVMRPEPRHTYGSRRRLPRSHHTLQASVGSSMVVSPGAARRLHRRAIDLYAKEDYLGALTAVDDALTLAPGSPSTLAVLHKARASANRKLGRFAAAGNDYVAERKATARAVAKQQRGAPHARRGAACRRRRRRRRGAAADPAPEAAPDPAPDAAGDASPGVVHFLHGVPLWAEVP